VDSLTVAGAAFFTAQPTASRDGLPLGCDDAAGLALFCVIGAKKALLAETGSPLLPVPGMITVAFDSLIRDVLGAAGALILTRETCLAAALPRYRPRAGRVHRDAPVL